MLNVALTIWLQSVLMGVVIAAQPLDGSGDSISESPRWTQEADAQEQATGQNTPPPTQRDTENPIDIETADGLLRRLEESADDLNSFDARLVYHKIDPFGGREAFGGRIVYRVDDAQEGEARRRRFAIKFDEHVIEGQRRARNEHIIFDGAWLTEIRRDEKELIKRQIVPPGEVFDPLKIGEGPFPLPIGQPRDEVQARFETALVEPPADDLVKALLREREVIGLQLTPRAETPEAEEYEKVAIYYDPETLLPVIVDAHTTGGARKVINLRDARRNVEIDAALLDADVRIDDTWRVDVKPWRE